jgi:hypothetical protein
MVMKTFHVLILAGAILGAAWILKPALVEQVSQAELQRRERLDREMEDYLTRAKVKECAAAVGKTVETLDRNDPKQEAVYRKCMWPEESRGRLQAMWDKIRGMW